MTGFFSVLGQPVSDAERSLVRDYLRGLGITESVPVEPVRDWAQARGVTSDASWDRRWWDAEQIERDRLRSRVFATHAEADALRLLSNPFDRDTEVQGAAARAAERAGCADVALVKSATGAASEALYLGALARLASEPAEHPFRLKETLFARGRWPLGILDARYWVF